MNSKLMFALMYLVGIAVWGASLCGATARADDLNFSFTGPETFLFTTDQNVGTFTVTGTIYGLINNGTSVPSSITASAEGAFVNEGVFRHIVGTVSLVNDVVQADLINADNRESPFASPSESITFDGFTAHLDEYHYDITGPVTFFDASSAAPEPTTWALMLAGVLAIGAPLRRRWRRGAIVVSG